MCSSPRDTPVANRPPLYHPPVPDFTLERAAGGRVAGVDEVGRGPLSGPVLAAAVVFPRGVPRKLAAMLDDSKKLSAVQRLEAFAALRRSTAEITIAAASIVAKVVRDHLMERLGRRYPGYFWDTNAGYATPAHHAALAMLGATPHHRAGFGPVARLLNDLPAVSPG